jgi:hypothetical protein
MLLVWERVRRGPVTEPTPRTELDDLPLDLDHYPADAQEGWEMICRAKRSLVRQSALLREIHAALGWRQKNMKERIERELEQAQNERKET